MNPLIEDFCEARFILPNSLYVRFKYPVKDYSEISAAEMDRRLRSYLQKITIED